MAQAILCHNEAHGIACESLLDKALFCADPLTGLITAAALIRPNKKLAGLTADSLMKRFKEKRFAAGATRENMAACSQLDLQLGEFLMLVRDGMLTISDQLGL